MESETGWPDIGEARDISILPDMSEPNNACYGKSAPESATLRDTKLKPKQCPKACHGVDDNATSEASRT